MKTNNTSPACKLERELPAYAQGELSAAAQATLEQHLASCPGCRKALQEYRELLDALRELPDAKLSPDVTARTLSQIHREAARRCFEWRPFLRAAALWMLVFSLAAIAASVVWTWSRRCGGDTARERAAQWLVSAQLPDGRWDVRAGSTPSRYAVGITALAMMALSGEGPALDKAAYSPVLAHAADYLVAQQAPDGRFGAVHSAAMYNTAMSVIALMRAGAGETDAARNNAVERGVAFILATQRPGGGWGYMRESERSMNTSITAWQLLALMEAQAAGRPDVHDAIRRGLDWMATTVDPKGRVGYSAARDFPFGYATLTAAGALCAMKQSAAAPQLLDAFLQVARETGTRADIYQHYFVAAALGEYGKPDARERLLELQCALRARQIAAGPDAGAWDSSDRWSSAGGPVYTTSMAMMALQVSAGGKS